MTKHIVAKESAAPNGSSKKLRINIATSGRFHVLYLARDLDALGQEVKLFSYVPLARAMSFGLPARCHVALLPFVFPLVVMERFFPNLLPALTERLLCWALNLVTILRMKPCDVFVCMSGIYLEAARFAKKRYGAKVVFHRGSRHIMSQLEIMSALPDSRPPSEFMVRREIEGYQIADKVLVPSTHVVESFAPWPEHARKLFKNRYGVDLADFPQYHGPRPTEPTVVCVGHWSYRKGSDLLTQAIEQLETVRLIHVGPIVDLPFPQHPRFTHHESVPQNELPRFYAAADVFALASREEGFSVTLSQALASGLMIVCSDRTGGDDLTKLGEVGRFVRVVPVDDAELLRHALKEALADARSDKGITPLREEERDLLSWRHFSIRYLEMMRGLTKNNRST